MLSVISKKKITKLVQQSKIITHQPKAIKSRNVLDKKLVSKYHSKTHKISKTIKKGKKISQAVGAGKSSISPFYSETTKRENFLNEKNANETISYL